MIQQFNYQSFNFIFPKRLCHHFADLWIQLLVPALDLLKENQKKKTKILTLTDLTENHLELSEENLTWLLDNSQYACTLDEIIAACIIGVKASPHGDR